MVMDPFLLGIFTLLVKCGLIFGHGILLDPPNRSSLWRYKFDVEPNYDDNQLFCGGYDVSLISVSKISFRDSIQQRSCASL